jgi:hypothetical protein
VRSGSNLENAQTFYKILPGIHIGKLPIMLKSSVCVLKQYQHINEIISGECKLTLVVISLLMEVRKQS